MGLKAAGLKVTVLTYIKDNFPKVLHSTILNDKEAMKCNFKRSELSMCVGAHLYKSSGDHQILGL